MKIFKGSKTTIKQRYIIVCIILCFFMQSGIFVSAEDINNNEIYDIGNGDTICNYQDLLSKYEINNIAYKRNMLDYQIQVLTGTLADESYASINSQYLDTVQKIAELNQTKEKLINYRDSLMAQGDTVSSALAGNQVSNNSDADYVSLIEEINKQIASIDSQISQYTSIKSSFVTNLSEAALQEDIADFYTDYQYLITKETQNTLENDFLKKCYNLIIDNKVLDYSNSYQKYLDLVMQTDTIKYKLGLITQIIIDTDNTNLLKNETTIEENQDTYNAALSYIKSETAITDNTKIRLCLSSTKKQYNLENTVNQFINNNSSYHQIENYIRSYQNYLGSASTKSYTLYHQTELRINDYYLQLDELKGNIRIFVKGAIQSYENSFHSMTAAWNDLQVKIKIYNASKAKLDYKRASQIELQQKLFEKKAAEVAYYQSCYKIIIWQNILDNNLYNITP